MKKEIEAFVNAANEQELEAAWNNLCLLYTSGGSLMAYKCLSLCDFFIVQHFLKQHKAYMAQFEEMLNDKEIA